MVIGYYQNGEKAKAMGQLPHADRLARAIEQGSSIHPQYRTELESAFSVAWEHVPFNRGGWAQYTEAQRKAEYVTLQQPHGALYLAGDEHVVSQRLDGRRARIGTDRRPPRARARVAGTGRGDGAGMTTHLEG